MRLTVRHHFDFGADRAVVGDDLVRPEAWDALRTQTSGAFALAETREQWERTADEHPELEARARRLDEVFGRLGAAEGRLVRRRRRHARVLAQAGRPAARPGRHRLRAGHGRAAEADLRRGRVRGPRPVGRRPARRRPAPLPPDRHRVREPALAGGVRALRRGADRVRGGRAGRSPRRPGRGPQGPPARCLAGRLGAHAAGAIEALWKQTHTAVPVDVGDLPAWELRPR